MDLAEHMGLGLLTIKLLPQLLLLRASGRLQSCEIQKGVSENLEALVGLLRLPASLEATDDQGKVGTLCDVGGRVLHVQTLPQRFQGVNQEREANLGEGLFFFASLVASQSLPWEPFLVFSLAGWPGGSSGRFKAPEGAFVSDGGESLVAGVHAANVAAATALTHMVAVAPMKDSTLAALREREFDV